MSSDIFLGQDFLIWLWFKSESQGGTFMTPQGTSFNVFMEQSVVVQGGEG